MRDRLMRPMPENVRRAVRDTLLAAARHVAQHGLAPVTVAIWRVQGSSWKRAAACARYGDIVGHYFSPRTLEEQIDCLTAAALWEDA